MTTSLIPIMSLEDKLGHSKDWLIGMCTGTPTVRMVANVIIDN
jgi:hypothetical protein